MQIEYRITLSDGQQFYLTVTVRKQAWTHPSKQGDAAAHSRAITDGLILAAVQAQHTEWWPEKGELASVEFYQIHPF